MIILVLAGLVWMYVARVVRGQVLSLKEKEFVEAARAVGRVAARASSSATSCPNIIGPIMVNATLGVAAAIIAESTLSFLGLRRAAAADVVGQHAVATPRATSGRRQAYLLYFPGLMILLTVLVRELPR